MWRNKLYAWLTLIGLASCAQAGKIPLCLYGVDNATDLKTIQKAGFSCFQTYKQEPERLYALAKQAEKLGLRAVFFPNKVLGSAYEKQAQSWPILAWYLVDEPDVWKWTRERVITARQRTESSFPHHLTTLVIGQGRTETPYYDLTDILMMDWYPVPHLPLESFGQNVAWAKQGQTRLGAAKKPLWGVVQLFDWKEYKQHRADNARIGRFPSEEEIRFMSYHGLVNGADGLFYFIFTSNGVPLPKAKPAEWARVKKTVRELAKFSKLIAKAAPADNPAEVLLPLQMRSWSTQNSIYSVLVNPSSSAQPVPETFLSKKYKPLLGTRKSEIISPYSVWVMKTSNK